MKRGLRLGDNDDPAAGFTLLELIVVLAIMGLGTALALPAARGPTVKASLNSAAAQLAGSLRLARAEALRTNTDQTLTLDVQRHLFWSDGDPKPHAIDRSFQVAVEDDNLEWSGHERRVRFKPDGSATGGTIVFMNDASRARVSVDWLTGATALDAGG
jgi:general secretion pathway protein H